MKFYYTGYSVMGRLHDGSWMAFATEEEYREYYESENED